MPRFSEFQSGAVFPLRTGELLRATLKPVSRFVHTAQFSVQSDGAFEFAEWVSGGGDSQFFRETQPMPASAMSQLCGHLDYLRKLRFNELDDEEEETPDRRGIQFWNGDETQGLSPQTPMDSAVRIHHDQVWQLLLSHLKEPHFGSEPAGKWAFPVQTVAVW